MRTTDPQSPTLCGWATLSEVSDALGIKHNTIRQAVRRALRDHQDWVKREPYPEPNSPQRWLIDTTHVMYQCHEKRWRKLAEKTSSEQIPETQDGAAYGKVCDTAQFCSAPCSQQHAIDVTKTWPELCYWLAEHGLVVFVNAIAANQSWQWSWMGSADSGYPDVTAAITAAVQYQLTGSDHFLSPLYATPTSATAPAESDLPLWNDLFHWKR